MPLPPEEVANAVGRLLSTDGSGGVFWTVSGNGRFAGMRAGSLRPDGYRWVKVLGTHIMEHRVIWFLTYGEWPDLEIDHIDRCRNNNHPSNLRLASRSQNSMNKRVRSDSSSGVKGVEQHGPGWRAKIVVGGIRRSLGTYKDVETARLAYQEASTKYHAEFSSEGTT